MKIDPNQEILKSAYTDKTIRPDKPADKEFGAMLKDAINKEPSKISSEKVKPQMVNNIPNIQLNLLFAVQDNPIAERTENFLNILEQYRNKLLDPQSSLRDIHPLIQRMETEQEALAPVLNSLPPGDGLKDILNDALVTSSLEVIKFNRGDYVDS
ncbi:MAG: hypothetical protein HN945_10270 [Deltaproteobacteria bacterium]|jgi:hypothetical protein|nr:hypothetical protein [Deltaproteobacteria bacterium]